MQAQEEELKVFEDKLASLRDGFSDTDRHLIREMIPSSTPQNANALGRRLRILNRIESLKLSIARLKYLIQRSEIVTQSGVVEVKSQDGDFSGETTNQTLVDVLGAEMTNVLIGKTVVSEQGQRNLLEISDFLARPAIIHSKAHAVGTSVDEVFDVWDRYTSLPSVRAKLRNYAYLKATLKIRISVSGTPFHIGRLLVSYQPYAKLNPNLQNLLNASATSDNYRPCLLNYLSQARGSTTMNVCENKPTELTIPFISTKPMHRLYNEGTTGPIVDTDPFDDLDYAGSLYVKSFSALSGVSASDTPIYMQVYAWMEDVQLGTNTGTQMEITTESGTVDERKTGPVERITSRMLRVSKALEGVGFLSPYAAASSLFLTGANKVASIMGWSKPVMNKETIRMKNDLFANVACTMGNDTAHRIVLDPAQELSIGPEVCGTETDEMIIQHIANRCSYLQTFTWDTTDDAMSDLLYACSVTPNLVTVGNFSPKRIVQPTAMAFAALPFYFWRGDIVFRFEVVCSQFHRGKLAVLYEPNLNQFGNIGSDLRINKQFVRVFDIQETNVFEVRVNWASYRSWLKVGSYSTAFINNDMLLTNNGNEFCNGCIIVSPFTDLQSPDSTGVTINVYVYSDNLQVNGLTEDNLYTDRAVVAAPGLAEIETESGSVSCINSLEVRCIDLNPSTASPDKICEEHFGEQPISFRALIKRYVTTNRIATGALAAGQYEFIGNIFPPSSLPYGTTGASVRDLFTYLRYAYLGYKGGIRTIFTANAAVQLGLSPLSALKAALYSPTSYTADTVTTSTTTYNSSHMEGAMISSVITGPAIHFETPFYTNNLFVFPFMEQLDDGLPSKDMMEDKWFRMYRVTFYAPTAFTSSSKVTVDQAGAEDFSFMRFLGAPYYTTAIA